MPLMEDLYAKQRARQVEIVPFFYSTQFLASAVIANGTVTQNIQISSDAHFVARYMNLTAYTNPATNLLVAAATVPLLIQLFDTASGRTLFDNPQPVQNVCGGVAAAAGMGHLPFIFPEPWLIRRSGVIQVSITNLANVVMSRVDLSLCGAKVFAFGGGAPGEGVI